jgi:DNA-binding NarL/FixJ family response regulator
MSAFVIHALSATSPTLFGSGTPEFQQPTDSPTNSTATTTTATQQDTATVSPTAQALLLYQQGETVSTIASLLGVSVSTVDSYLNISVQATPVVQAPPTATAKAAGA